VSVEPAADAEDVSCQQYFQDPVAGSPNVSLLQGTDPVNTATTNLVSVPYFTERVPVKEQYSFS
jgi:hypothetical protein